MRKVFRGEGKDVSKFSKFERLEHNLATPDTITEICGDNNLMDEMWEYCNRKKIVGFDLETSGLDFFKHDIILAQIGDHERQFLIWVQHTDCTRLLEVMRDPEVIKVGLNLKFDLTFSLHEFGMVAARAQNVVDVLLTAQILMCGIYDNVGLTMRMSSMATQSQHWLGLSIPKDSELRTGWGDGWDPISFQERIERIRDLRLPEGEDAIVQLQKLRDRKLLYAADDVCIPISIAYKHKPWIQHLNLQRVVNLENSFLPVISDIEVRGLPFDLESWLVLADSAEEEVKAATHALDELFDVTVTVDIDAQGRATYDRDKNYTSPQQLQDLIRQWMWDNCGVDVICTNKHFRESLERYGRMNADRIALIFSKGSMPDPDNPKKKKKFGYPAMSDILESSWDLHRGLLPPEAFVLPNTDSGTLKLYKILYTANRTTIKTDTEYLPNTHGLPPALIDPILALRGSSKSVSTYGRSWVNYLSKNGRMHTNFRQAALSTGRLSASPNTMNFPADAAYRAAFKARPGYKMVGADYSQIEPRVIAHLSSEPTYMRVFWSELPESAGFSKWCDYTVTEELDLYTEVGKQIGQLPPYFTKKDTKGEHSTPEGEQGRKQAKVANLGLGYGTGKTKFHKMLAVDTGQYVTYDDAVDLYDKYWSAMGVMKAYLDTSSSFTDPERSERKTDHPYVSKGLVTYAETLIGRKRFFEESNPTWWTQGRNQPIQGTAGGDMLKMAALELTHWAWENNIDGGLVNLIHDELLAEVREDQAPAFAQAMSHCMERVGSELCPTVPILAGSYIADHWIKD